MDRRGALKSFGAALLAGMTPLQVAAKGRVPQSYLRTNWSRDPFSYGSYSYFAKGTRRIDRRNLERPVESRIYFAGEAVFPKYNSTVHAAHESGLRTAGMLARTGAQRIAVIGAGMAGLSAGQRLVNEGRDVTVFEARDRIGGRIWTSDALGMPLDLGASWIHGIEGNPLSELANMQGMARIPTDDSGVIRGGDGRLISDDDAPDWLEDVTEIQNSAGADSDALNYSAYLLQSDYEGAEVVFPNGYAPMLKALAGAYELRLATQVVKIRLAEQGVWIVPRGARPENYDAVIVTVPLGVLKSGDIAFDPPLPDAKRKSIRRLGMGTLDKVYLRYDQVFWDREVIWISTPETGLPRGQFNLWLNLDRVFGVPVLMALNGGSAARELAKLSDSDVIKRASNVIESAYPA